MSKPVDTLEDLFKWGSRPMADTSLAAFDNQKPKIKDIHIRIMSFVDDAGPYGCTLDEICVRLKILIQTGSARVRELVQADELKDSGKRRPTRTGSSARVYVRKEKP